MIGELLANEADSWTQFHVLYGGFVNEWIRRAGLDANEAADVSQEVFCAVTASIVSYQHSKEKSGSFRAWLFGITRNKINDFFRKQSRLAIPEGGETGQIRLQQIAAEAREVFESEASADGSISVQVWSQCEVTLVSKSLHDAVRQVQNDFGEQTWQVFWRVIVHGEAPAQVALDLSISPEAARQAKFRVLKRMREELSNQEI